MLFVGMLNAQTTFKSLQKFDNKTLDFKRDRFSTRQLTPLKISLPDKSLLEQQNYVSEIKLFSPQQYNLTNYPMNDLADMDDLLMGTSLSNTLHLGRQSIETTYIFDLSGNLQGSQTSFIFGKKKNSSIRKN